MVLFNYAIREITAKIVYYGPGLGGKTTNLQRIHESLDAKARGKLISLATDADRTLFFDFMPLDLGYIGDYRVRFQLYTVPGQVHYNATRKLVLKGVDAVVFVADSQIEMIERDRESYDNLKENLTENGYELKNIPIVFQFNKQDLPNIATPEEIASSLEVDLSKCTYYESVAIDGKGIFECLKAIIKVTVEKLRQQFEVGRLQAVEVVPGPASSPPEETAAPVESDEIESLPEGISPHEQTAPDELSEEAVFETQPEIPVWEEVRAEMSNAEMSNAEMDDAEMDEVDLETLLAEEIPEKEPEMEIVYSSEEGDSSAEEIEKMMAESKEDLPEEPAEEITSYQTISEAVEKGPDEERKPPEEITSMDEISLQPQPMQEEIELTGNAIEADMGESQEEQESESLLEEAPGYELDMVPGHFPETETEEVIFTNGKTTPEAIDASDLQEESMAMETAPLGSEEEPAADVIASPEVPEPEEEAYYGEPAPEKQKPEAETDDMQQLKEEMASIRGKTDDLEKSLSAIKSTLEENRRLMDKVIDIATGRSSPPVGSDKAGKPDLPDKLPRRRGLLSRMFGK